jgi:hypothetical protein
VKFKDATPDQIVAEMGEWWKIESFRTAAPAMVAAEMKVLIEKDMAERRKRGGRVESLFGLLL